MTANPHQNKLELLSSLQQELSTRLENLTRDMTKSHSSDSSEQAVERENDEVIEQLEHDTREELQQVTQAIARIKDGSYGICSQCEEEISPQRLEVMPYTSLCIKCAD